MTCNPNFVLREIYGQSLLMPFHRNEIGNEPIHLNDVAAVIWRKAGESGTVNELLDSVTALYQLTPGSAEQGAVGQFIGQLLQMKLIAE